MRVIGGYPELELRKGNSYHKDALRLNTARNCLEYILRIRNFNKVYIPYFTCEAIIEPFRKTGVDYEFYQINNKLELDRLFFIKDNEALLYTNYFGLKQEYIKLLFDHYGKQLIIDNAQGFFEKPIKGVDTFYSARKFVGVPDGAYLYTNFRLNSTYTRNIAQDASFDRMYALLKRLDTTPEEGYSDFIRIESSLSGIPIRWMSKLTEKILGSIDYKRIKKQRIKNYEYLDSHLSHINEIKLRRNPDSVPMAYPFKKSNLNLHSLLIKNKIYVPTFWPNVFEWVDKKSLEYQLAKNMVPLPIDQRYNTYDMKQIINLIESNI